jgi:secreted PhoX family phosphatase
MTLPRRDFLLRAAAVPLGFSGLDAAFRAGSLGALTARTRGLGPLVPDPRRTLDLPEGFSYNILNAVGELMDDGFFFPGKPDGMAAFPGPDGKTILLCNHENDVGWPKSPFGRANRLLDKVPADRIYDRGQGKTPGIGGCTATLYDTRTATRERLALALVGTFYNCAGGPTPWGTWITCEETTHRPGPRNTLEKDHGYAFEVPVRLDDLPAKPVPLKAMGRFRREAVGVCPRTSIVYQSEDIDLGLFYRFIPNVPGRLAEGGRLQALAVRGQRALDTTNWSGPAVSPNAPMPCEWIDLTDPESPMDNLRFQGESLGCAIFSRNEGVWFGTDGVYFVSTTGGPKKIGQIWRYRPSPAEGTPGEAAQPGTLELFLESADSTVLRNADNITQAPWGDLVVCEDSKSGNHLLGITPKGAVYRIAQNVGSNSELAGCTFSPDGTTLFVNIQGDGLTLAIRGPWDRARG